MHALDQHQKREVLKRLLTKTVQNNSPKDIAIIGVSGRYPMARTIDEFWENIKQGKNCISEIPRSRWDWEKYYQPDGYEQGSSYTKWGGFIEDIDKFDSSFFNITPKEAEEMDPQERLFLQTAWSTLEDAGMTRSSLTKKNPSVGVFVGVMNNFYVRQGGTSAYWSIANRISYFLNLQGPSLAVDTACSSSLTAIHLACESLKKGECHTAIAGGVNLIVHPEHYQYLSRMNMLSKEDRCKAFGAEADGFVDGEGLGAVLLKPLNKAMADNDQIYAVIKGTSINAGGKTSGYTVPNPNAQADLIKAALREADVPPETISYVEAHGTGTSLGDPIEIAGLTTAFQGDNNPVQNCPVGSVKSNIGHLESAAGIAGLTKVLWQMKHKQLAPSLHTEQLNPRIAFEDTPFYVQQELSEWKQPVKKNEKGDLQTYPRRASISSFGAGGANAHLIVEEYNEQPVQTRYVDEEQQLYLLSARDEERLREYALDLRSFLVQNRTRVNLADIAYTLQIGREAMESRLAIVAHDIEALVEKLSFYIQGQINIENCYKGSETRKVKQDIQDSLEQKDLKRLAGLWVFGTNVDWSKLYQGKEPRKVSLPTYPFAKESHWISGAEDVNKENTDKLHPLLDRNVSSLKEQKFTVRLTGQEFFMVDHKIGNQIVLPGSAMIEMTRAAVSFSTEDKIRSIKDIVWKQPVSLDEFTPKDVSVSLYLVEGGVEYEIWSTSEEQQRTVHAEGLMKHDVSETKKGLDINKILSRCTDTMTQEECYERFQKVGLNYGISFQTIQLLFNNREEALAELHLPIHLRENHSDFELHPSLLDGAFQAVVGLLADKVSESASYLPYSLGEAILFRPLTERCYAYVAWAEEQPIGCESMYDFMIKIVDEEGQVLVYLKNFTVKMSLMENQLTKNCETIYLQKVWQKKEIEFPSNNKGLSGNILLFDSDDSLRNTLYENMNDQVLRIIQVKQGDRFTCVGPDTYEINPAQHDDYWKLLRSIREEELIPNHIIHFWSKVNDNKSIDLLGEQLQQSIYSVLYLSQALIDEKLQDISLAYVYPIEGNTPLPQYAAVHALAQTIQLENPQITTKTVGISSEQQPTNVGHIITKELTFETDHHSDIQYVSDQRYVYSLQELQVQETKAVPLRENGVYIISGGTGGLGFLFAEYLTKFQAKLILVGRSEWSLEIEKKVKKLEDMGSEVEYVSADVSHRYEVTDLIAKTRKRFNQIHGIIHSAGVIRDSLVYRKSKEDIHDVLSPKVYGTTWLDECTKDEKLDFFCLFSSLSGLLGNVGQADYAYANSFMDYFTHLREERRKQEQRHGKTFSINWPYWEQGGMQLATHEQTWLKQVLGLLPLRTDNGFKAFEKGLIEPISQLVVMEGNKSKLLQAVNNPLPKFKANSQEHLVERSEQLQLQQKTEQYLKEILSEETKVPVSKIVDGKAFEKFGIDSVIIMRMIRRLEKVFGELPKTIYYEFQTIEELATYFMKNHGHKLIHILGLTKGETTKVKEKNIVDERLPKKKKQRVRFENNDHRREDIAIIGLSGRYPQADHLDQFWEVLKSGHNCITEIPEERWDYMEYYDPEKKAGKSYSKWGGFINDFDKFDSLFFNISPKEAKFLDPQERLFLETVWHTLEDAGYTKTEMEHRNVGVFVGVMYGQYQLYGVEEQAKGNYIIPNSSYSSIANRVSYFFHFHGPSMALDTMCSSSLTAIHLAVNSLQQRESEVAVAGGVNLTIHPSKYLQLSEANFASSDGQCRSFGEGGDGYVPGEGVGAVLLKPLNKAINDGDHIYGVIKASTLNHGGKTNGYTVPNPNAQGRLIKEALKKAKVSPRDISYVEAHGTGTSLGDPIEINGLIQAFGKDHTEQYCSIGSVKSNIGHLESAAGIAALTKVLLQMKHKQLVPSIHSSRPNPNINFSQSPFYLQQSLEEWKQLTVSQNGQERKVPRIAGISSFGAGGSNAHLIIEEYEHQSLPVEVEEEPQLLILSARNKNRVQEYASKMVDFIDRLECDREAGIDQSVPQAPLSDIAYTLRCGREELEERLAIIASNIEEFKDKLNQYIQGQDTINFYSGNVNDFTKISHLWSDERDIQSIVTKWGKNGELSKIAEVWVGGTKIQWDQLSLGKGQKQPLPTYPFKKERHWIPQVENKTNNIGYSYLHPLVESIHPDLSLKHKGLVYQKTLKSNDLIVKDHCVERKRLFPGVGQLEMALGAVSHLKQNNDYSLANVVWLQPIRLDQEKKQLRILINEKNEHLTFDIQSVNEGQVVTHSKGEARKEYAEYATTIGKEEHISVEEIKSRAAYEFDKTEFYRRFSKVGIDYGPYFQGVQHIWGNQWEALSILQLPQGQEEQLRQYTLHPSLVDGALQTIAGIDGHDDELKLPYSVERVKVKRPISVHGYAYVRSKGGGCYQVEIMDKEGRVCISMQDVTVRSAYKETHPATNTPTTSIYYKPIWKPVPLPTHPQPDIIIKQKVLIIARNESIRLDVGLAEAYKGSQVYFIRLGKDNKRSSDNTWEINCGDPYSLKDCLHQIPHDIDMIYFLGGIQGYVTYSTNIDQLNNTQETGVLSLFRLVQALSEQGYNDRYLRLHVITSQVYTLTVDEMPNPYTAGIHGLTKSMIKEYPNWDISYTDINLESFANNSSGGFIKEDIIKTLIAESYTNSSKEVFIHGGRRYVRSLSQLSLPAVNESCFRQHGVYLILGGAGGIGLELCRYLARQADANIILIGRSPLNKEKKQQIAEIEEHDGQILYIQADGTDLKSMYKAVQEAKSRFGEIHGVIHSAIILKDSALENMDEESFRSALSPKVQGSYILHQVLRDEPLDFMMFFSSAQSFTGNAGQSNYAAACTFKDAFAQYLKRTAAYPVKIINWGYWGDVGVVASEQYQKRLAAQGIYSIDLNEGMGAIERVLYHPIDQVMVMKAEKEVLQYIGVDMNSSIIQQPHMPTTLHLTIDVERRPMLDKVTLQKTKIAFLELEKLSKLLLLNTFQEMGVFKHGNGYYQKEELKKNLGIIARYEHLYEALLDIMVKSGLIQIDDQDIRTTSRLDDLELQEELQQLKHRFNQLASTLEIKAHVELLWTCFQHYPDILRGHVPATDIIFPEASMAKVEDIYQNNVTADYFNKLVVWGIRSYIHKRLPTLQATGKIKILEVGAGTGGTSAAIFDGIREFGDQVEYMYTDISPGFIKYGQKQYGMQNHFVQFGLLDIEKDIQAQGYEFGEYDVVIAANVLHATRKLQLTLNNIKRLLKTNGWIILNEATVIDHFTTLTFGLLEGWWLYEDPEERLPNSPLLSPSMWEGLLKRIGFEQTIALEDTNKEKSGFVQNIILGESNGQIKVTQESGSASMLAGTDPSAIKVDHQASQEVAVTQEYISPPKTEVSTEDQTHQKWDYIQGTLVDCIVEVLEVNIEEIDIEKQFSEYGVDSITGLELVKKINETLGITLKTTALFDYSNVQELTDYILEQYGEKIFIAVDEDTGEQDEDLELLNRLASGKLTTDKVYELMGWKYGTQD